MAKMFYTLEEAASRLGMTETEVQNLTESGQLQEFRDRERLMFKVDQVDLLAGDDGEDDVQLADTGAGLEPISLSSSNTGSNAGSNTGSNIGAPNPNEGTGVSIFDPEDDSAADANAETLVTNGIGGGLGGSGFNMDAGASGSGLAQLAFEPDDTSLGGNLLDASNAGDSQADMAGTSAGALFETSAGEPDFTRAAPAAGMSPMMALGEPYDGPASGLFGGIALGVFLLTLLAMAVMILGMSGGSPGVLGGIQQNTLYIVAGGGAVALIVFGAIGWAALRRS
jgi:hypothetical protein